MSNRLLLHLDTTVVSIAAPPFTRQVWKIKRFTGAAEHSLRAEVTMVSTTKERKPWARPPISMNFQVGIGACIPRAAVAGNCTGHPAC